MRRRYGTRAGWLPAVAGLLLFAAVAIWAVGGIRDAAEASRREGARAAEEAARQAAAACYALDGAYPASYEELAARTGLAIDTNKYKVFYEAFAENIMPEITAVERPEGAP